ncbi:DUF397 domain-containing protein [Micromonospora sp. NPDC049102]|uniref:DUF397 domain-containing protein n=1 Tax=Micromonospora sp. NPDC049102 TaxID=3364265 RepID=UPI00371AEA41
MSSTLSPSAASARRWWQTITTHQPLDGRCPRCGTRGRCWSWAQAFGQLVAHDLWHLGPPAPTTSRTRRPAEERSKTLRQLTFVRPKRCGSSGPNCVEVAIDADLNRIVRNSQRPDEQVTFDEREWSAFIASVRAGQAF